ncbi:hypothetical protein L9F63_006249 [Diploptera punctata]|uniref:CS domain-containing protein n=1 Tax=Diploptera punctata TaxID=6984 RepID=A0AAD7ZBD6_DIPPU|nr:hypothetical protein L9F63_006249 [Diploptera punctata]
MALSKHDEIFFGVMKEKGHIVPFLDAVFGFLYRCTDFYCIQDDTSDKVGFPPGIAENCVLKVMRKWEKQARQDDDYYYKKRNNKLNNIPAAIEEVEVVSDDTDSKVSVENKTDDKSSDEISKKAEHTENHNPTPADSYNGAVLDNYRWSQTIKEIDIQVPVPSHITKARDVKVNVTATSISVSVKDGRAGEWNVLMEGDLSWKNNKQESLWNLEPGKHVQVYLEKVKEQWWDSLLVSEPKIDLSKIDASRPMEDLAQDEQMKIQELMWNQERKSQGLPTSDQLITEKILKEAWNKEGSPFLGTEYDPSLINFGNNCVDITETSVNPS